MAFLEIDGVPVSPTPSTCEYRTADLHDNATRGTAAGVLVVDLVRSNIRSITVEWYRMTPAQLKQFYMLWGSQMFHSITYFDPIMNMQRTGTFYRGDVTSKPFKVNRSGFVTTYVNVRMTFIER